MTLLNTKRYHRIYNETKQIVKKKLNLKSVPQMQCFCEYDNMSCMLKDNKHTICTGLPYVKKYKLTKNELMFCYVHELGHWYHRDVYIGVNFNIYFYFISALLSILFGLLIDHILLNIISKSAFIINIAFFYLFLTTSTDYACKRYSYYQEHRADLFAISILDTEKGALTFFTKIEYKDGMTHPSSTKRMEYLKKKIKKICPLNK